MKKIIVVLLICLLALSLVACNQKPSVEDVTQALQNGTLTLSDAVKKGYVTQEWADEYLSLTAVPAADKTISNQIGAFETSTLQGETFTRENVSFITYYAFINADSQAGQEAYQVLHDNYDAVKAKGADVLVITLNDKNKELFQNAKMPVVYYNESMQSALGNLCQMVNTDSFSGAWNGNTAFLSAWNLKIEKDTLLGAMTSIVDMLSH